MARTFLLLGKKTRILHGDCHLPRRDFKDLLVALVIDVLALVMQDRHHAAVASVDLDGNAAEALRRPADGHDADGVASTLEVVLDQQRLARADNVLRES